MKSSHGRQIQGRRALAILAWVTLVIVAGLLWYGQQKRIIRVQAWEPAALLLSAYAAFLAIFGWQLFSPGRASAEESPGLFFAGMLTLLPPCFIAYNLMPVGSPLKPWLTLGVFVFGIIAIMSPLPEEVFAVPRHRRSYLRPLTDAYLSEVDAEEPQITFDDITPRTQFWLTRPSPETDPGGGDLARDPWADPFHGTNRQMSRIGVSQSRRAEESSRSNRQQFSEPPSARAKPPGSSSVLLSAIDERSGLDPAGKIRGDGSASQTPASFGTSGSALKTDPHRSATDTAEPSRVTVSGSTIRGSVPLPSTARRPLTDPIERSANSVGFQTPVQGARTTPPPLPPSETPRAIAQRDAENTPVPRPSLPTIFRDTAARDTVAGTAASGLSHLASSPPAPPRASGVPAQTRRPLSEPEDSASRTQHPTIPPRELSLRELDQQLREQNFSDAEDDANEPADTSRRPSDSASQTPPGITRSAQQATADVKLERISDEHGGEMIEGTISVFFEVGQKRAHLHVPFSPPLAGLPEVECEPVDDDSIRLKVAVRQPYGVRIEARRTESAESLRTEISFAAVYTPPARRG